MKNNQVILDVKFSELLTAFEIKQPQVYALQTEKKLPKRPARKVTLEWVLALVDWMTEARGRIPFDALDVFSDITKGRIEDYIDQKELIKNDYNKRMDALRGES